MEAVSFSHGAGESEQPQTEEAVMRTKLVATLLLASVAFCCVSVVRADDPSTESSDSEVLKELKKLTQLVTEQDAEIKGLKQELDKMRETIRQTSVEQQIILDRISRRDSEGRPILALNNIMESSPEFKQELSDAVHKTLKVSGSLVVRNKMTTSQILAINGKQEFIAPQTTARFDVPVGTLTTELVGQEAAKNWTVGAPTYLQEINIEPASVSRVIVNRPVVQTPVYVEPPVVYGAPIYIY